jgi:hypothetical protein
MHTFIRGQRIIVLSQLRGRANYDLTSCAIGRASVIMSKTPNYRELARILRAPCERRVVGLDLDRQSSSQAITWVRKRQSSCSGTCEIHVCTWLSFVHAG